jgi:trk system potassium uptake protein TrkH
VIQAAVPPRALLLIFFTGLIALGTLLLLLPGAWGGAEPLGVINALFISTSAVCVTGLTTVDIADFTFFGQMVVLLLIQAGGLGLITFTTLFLLLPGRRLSFRTRHFIQSYSLPVVEHDPARLTLYIASFTLLVEAAGAAALYPFFKGRVDDPLFLSVFHAVSAFCNAGLSPIRTSFEQYRTGAYLLLTVATLIVSGGLGFVVFVDLVKRAAGGSRAVTFHTRITVIITAALVVAGACLFYLFEAGRAMSDLSVGDRVVNALFQSITPRTAGFDALPQGVLSPPSLLLTMLLMFIGGSPGSCAGGIKTTTAFLVYVQLFVGRDRQGEITLLGRKVGSSTLSDALMFAVRALGLLTGALFLLLLFESGSGKSFISLAFESFSAFATVGLSMGITSTLSPEGKLVIMATMFIGRVGLISLAATDRRPRAARIVEYPQGEVLIG